MITLLIAVMFIMLIVLTIAINTTTKTANSIVLFFGYGLISTILYFLFSAPDVALTEAVIGSGLSAVVLFVAYLKINQQKKGVNDES